MTDSPFISRLEAAHHKMAEAARACGRDPLSVRLLAASKTQSQSNLEEAIKVGHRLFGENRVQETIAKWPGLRETYKSVELHLIGPLQSNKTDQAVRLFDVIETLDRWPLAEALAKSVQKIGRHPRLFLEVNIGSEPQKAGIDPDEIGSFIIDCKDKLDLTIEGLMCIPPQLEDPRPYFKTMRELAAGHDLKELSMGMSGDFETAIGEGATIIRLGTALFGERP